MNFYSSHPRNMVLNVAKSLAKKVFKYSHKDFHQINTNKIRRILVKNNFPVHEIERIVDMASKPASLPKKTSITANKPSYSSFTYVSELSEALTNQIKYFMPDVTVANKPELKLDRFYSKQKDKLNDEVISYVVFELDCLDCDTIYIGETIQKAGVRKKQHIELRLNHQPSKAKSCICPSATHPIDITSIRFQQHQDSRTKLQQEKVADCRGKPHYNDR